MIKFGSHSRLDENVRIFSKIIQHCEIGYIFFSELTYISGENNRIFIK